MRLDGIVLGVKDVSDEELLRRIRSQEIQVCLGIIC